MANTKPGKARKPETEITPAMIEAGVKELKLSFSLDGEMDDAEDVVVDVFMAMMQASPRTK